MGVTNNLTLVSEESLQASMCLEKCRYICCFFNTLQHVKKVVPRSALLHYGETSYGNICGKSLVDMKLFRFS